MAFKMRKPDPKGLSGNSPAKNYANPQDYKIFNMGNKPTPMKDLKPGAETGGLPHNTKAEVKAGKVSRDHLEKVHGMKASPSPAKQGAKTKRGERTGPKKKMMKTLKPLPKRKAKDLKDPMKQKELKDPIKAAAKEGATETLEQKLEKATKFKGTKTLKPLPKKKKSPVKQKELSKEKGDLFLKGKTKDKDGNIVDIKWAPPTKPKGKFKDWLKKKDPKKKSPAKQRQRHLGHDYVDAGTAKTIRKVKKAAKKVKKAVKRTSKKIAKHVRTKLTDLIG